MPNSTENVEHLAIHILDEDVNEWVTQCSCGAKWSHPASRSKEEMDEIYESHKRYFNHPKMETL